MPPLWALALINEGPIALTSNRPPGKHLGPRGPRPYFETHNVTITVPARTRNVVDYAARKIVSGIKHRRHEVRGHWRCISEGRRIWIREHMRGDASIGYVRTNYHIETRH